MKNRILIISHNPFSQISNNGKTLEAIFSKFGKEELFQLYFVDLAVDPHYATSYFSISDMGVLKSIFGKTLKNEYQQSVSRKNVEKETSTKTSGILRFLRQNNTKLAVFRDILWNTVQPQKNKVLAQWIEEINPNFVFYVGGFQTFSHKITREFVDRLNVNLGVFFTDDYILHPENKSIFEKIQHRRALQNYYQTINKASICFTIGELMSEEYTKFFNKSFHTIMNVVDTKNPIIQQSFNDKFTISYFGGLHLDRWKKLIEFGKELDTTRLVLQVFTNDIVPAHILNGFSNAGIIYKGGVQDQMLRDEIGKSDALIHVESDNPKYRSLTKLSVSTKIPEYLNTNKLVIAFGPDDIASIKLIKDNQVGLVMTDRKEIKAKIDTILSNPNQIKLYADKGREFVKANFDIEHNSVRFKEMIETAIHED